MYVMPMPHAIVDAHRCGALEPIVAEVHAEIRAALHAIVHPSGGLQTAKCVFALTYDGFNIEFYDRGQPFQKIRKQKEKHRSGNWEMCMRSHSNNTAHNYR
jgi:hypothetical protein